MDYYIIIFLDELRVKGLSGRPSYLSTTLVVMTPPRYDRVKPRDFKSRMWCLYTCPERLHPGTDVLENILGARTRNTIVG